MSDEIEKQVERALKAYGFNIAPCNARFMLEDFAAGKFKEEPLPEIAKPPFIADTLAVEPWVDYEEGKFIELFRVMSTTTKYNWAARGPARPTKRLAILAWNEVFRA